METRIIGRLEWDEPALAADLNTLESFPPTPSYADYAIGDWSSYPLWNRTGRVLDGQSIEYDAPARKTELGQQLPCINQTIEQVFRTEHVRSVRIFSAQDNALIIPHRDYLEFERGFTRVHLPLQFDEWSFSSQENLVYRMNRGEIWYLDASKVHSGGSFSKLKRLLLVVDFDPVPPIDELFREPAYTVADAQPTRIARKKLDEGFLGAIYGLGQVINEMNFKDIVTLLAKVHFRRDVHVAAMYDWLTAIAERSGDAKIVSRAEKLKRYFIIDGPGVVSDPWS